MSWFENAGEPCEIGRHMVVLWFFSVRLCALRVSVLSFDRDYSRVRCVLHAKLNYYSGCPGV